ncbi:MAG: hypothetical protein L6R40_005223 [Gallowayella cf. fulva]|nr:MAG: hypothetical protein L6R40_005223 [Xanthomendoza cf. fulva]
MNLRHRFFVYLSCALALCLTTLTTPTQPAFSHLLNAGSSNTSINLENDINNPAKPALQPNGVSESNPSHRNAAYISLLTKNLTNANYFTVPWKITDTLSLSVNVGPWQLNQTRILETLAAAEISAGKKPMRQVLDKKFVQPTGSRINRLLFEISPGVIEPKHLTWEDVAQVLGENGLSKFFRQEGYWVSTYFDVIDSTRGKVGYGAVRKWYQLKPPGVGRG